VGRIRDRATFVALRSGRRVRRGPLTVTWLPGGPDEPPRVAYAIGRGVGSAVARNRVRRRLRAIVSELDPPLPHGAYLIGVAPAAAGLSYGELRTTVSTAVSALRRSSAGRPPAGAPSDPTARR
jgi:ribonuclease P protein component